MKERSGHEGLWQVLDEVFKSDTWKVAQPEVSTQQTLATIIDVMGFCQLVFM